VLIDWEHKLYNLIFSSQSKRCLHNNNTNNMLSAVSRNVSVLRTGARSMSTIPVNQIASVLKLNAGGEDKVRNV